MWAFLWFPTPFKSWTLFDDGPYISLAQSRFSLFFATLYCYHNNLILLGLFWASRLFLLQWLVMATILLLLMGSYVPLGIHGPFAFFGLPRPICFSWAFY